MRDVWEGVKGRWRGCGGEEVVNWCWEVAVGREEAETTRILQYQRFLDASANE